MRVLLCALVYAGVLGAAVARAQTADDPRFFGRYCGNATIERCVNVRVTFLGITVSRRRECRRLNVRDVDLQVDYTATAHGGLVSGSGRALLDGNEIGVVLAGAVTRRGRVRGSMTVSGLAPQRGSARLSEDGLALTVSAYNNSVTLRKDACGNVMNSKPETPIIIQPLATDTIIATGAVLLKGRAFDAEDGLLSGSSLVWEVRQGNGPLQLVGTGTSMWTSFATSGLYAIRLTAIDSLGAASAIERTVNVEAFAGNTPPIVSIERPDPVTTPVLPLVQGEPYQFIGSAEDAQDATSALDLTWRADPINPPVPGFVFGTGSTTATTSLTLVGGQVPTTYQITFRATDTGGLSQQKVITVEVWPYVID